MLLFMLSGCGVLDAAFSPQPEPAAAPSTSPPAADPFPNATAMPRPPPPPRPIPAARRTAPVETTPDPIVGKSEVELIALLGPPSSIREELTAKIWRYVAGDCQVDVYLYFNIEARGFKSMVYKFPKGRERAPENLACLRDLQENAMTKREDEN